MSADLTGRLEEVENWIFGSGRAYISASAKERHLETIAACKKALRKLSGESAIGDIKPGTPDAALAKARDWAEDQFAFLSDSKGKVDEQKTHRPESAETSAIRPIHAADVPTHEECVTELDYWQREADKESGGGESGYEREHIARMLRIHKAALRSVCPAPEGVATNQRASAQVGEGATLAGGRVEADSRKVEPATNAKSPAVSPESEAHPTTRTQS